MNMTGKRTRLMDMDFSAALAVTQAVEGLWPVFAGFGEMKKDRKARPGAAATYISYQTAATRSLASLSVMVGIGVPPRILGSIWTYPTVFRAQRLFVDGVGDMLIAFGQMVMLGDYDVVEAAYEFGLRFGECSKDLPTTRGGLVTRIAMSDEYQARLDAANKALRTFVLAARKDLGIKGRTTPSEAVAPTDNS
jgi:hypothetical protein